MKKIILIIFLILISPILLLFLNMLPSIIYSYRDIPFDTSMISRVTFYQIDPYFENKNYIEYLEKRSLLVIVWMQKRHKCFSKIQKVRRG